MRSAFFQTLHSALIDQILVDFPNERLILDLPQKKTVFFLPQLNADGLLLVQKIEMTTGTFHIALYVEKSQKDLLNSSWFESVFNTAKPVLHRKALGFKKVGEIETTTQINVIQGTVWLPIQLSHSKLALGLLV